MQYNNYIKSNDKGVLCVEGVNTLSLAAKYGTPLYVMSENLIRERLRTYKNAIKIYYSSKGKVLYASKAFICKEMFRILKSEGVGADVASGGELFTALSSGFSAQDIYFHGNNKSFEELSYAVNAEVGRIVVDNMEELEMLNSIAVSMNKKVSILLRIKPGVEAHTHEYIKTGQMDSKFGMGIEEQAPKAFKKALEMKGVELVGIHCHIGSQIFDVEPFGQAALTMLAFAIVMKKRTGFTIKELNLGGGFGVKYTDEDKPAELESFVRIVSEKVNAFCDENDFARPFILLEPGRSIVGDAGITLYKAGFVKDIADVRTYVGIDGGMCDNPRYALYRSKYDAVVAKNAAAPKNTVATLAGRCCESGDIVQEHVQMQKVHVGDIIAVLGTGAYNYSMSSNYNRFGRPAVIMVNGNEDRMIIKAESYNDIIRNDI